MLRINLNKLWKKRSVTITDYDPTYRVVYLGNVVTGWAKGDGCVDRPIATLWRNYCQSNKADVSMKLTATSSGLKAVTREHGLTEYWSHRITWCCAPASQPRIFCWVYRHEGRKLKQELRCHAVLCTKASKARSMANALQERLALALHEFKREKICRQNARLSLANCVYDNPSLPRRKILLSTGVQNYRPPLERSKSAPKLTSIEEITEEVWDESDDETDQEDTTSNSVISEPTSDVVPDYDSSSDGVASEEVLLKSGLASWGIRVGNDDDVDSKEVLKSGLASWGIRVGNDDDVDSKDVLKSGLASWIRVDNEDNDDDLPPPLPLQPPPTTKPLSELTALLDSFSSSPCIWRRDPLGSDDEEGRDEDDSLSDQDMERTVVEIETRTSKEPEQDSLSDESGYSEDKFSLSKDSDNAST